MAANDPLVEVSDLEARLGRSLSGTDATRATALISDASGLVFTLLGTDDPWPDGIPLSIVGIVCQMVQRGFENPRALSAETIGDYSWQASGSSGVYFTNAERRMIRRAYGRLSVVALQLKGDLPLRPDIFGVPFLFEDCDVTEDC